MSLSELWKNSRDQLINKQVQQVIAFAGEGKLRDGNNTSNEFRDFLSHISSELLSKYAGNCLTDSFTDSGLALQDIVNQIGRRLGFEVEDGRYRGTRDNIGNDGLWRFPNGHHVVVEVKTTDAYRIDSNTIAEYRRKLIANAKISEEDSSILIVVGREDTGDLEAQIRGSRHAWDIRLVSIDSLLNLMILKERVDDPQTIQRICDILIPQEFTRLDGIIDIVFSTSEEAKEETVEIQQFSELDSENEASSDEKQPVIPMAFHEACIDRFSNKYSLELLRESKTKYVSSDRKTRVVCMVSRDYTNTENASYWYGYHTHQMQFLDKGEESYLLLGCGSPDKLLRIAQKVVKGWRDDLNTTTKQNDLYWHLHIFFENERYFLERKKGKGRLDITDYLV